MNISNIWRKGFISPEIRTTVQTHHHPQCAGPSCMNHSSKNYLIVLHIGQTYKMTLAFMPSGSKTTQHSHDSKGKELSKNKR